uniref:Uncharacterized protein n=1 Tax=Timema cristinae TaxID=61476 RepID=A0A7R9GS56_TIMCR|nr:unnamed protein product [Timema cristinae]
MRRCTVRSTCQKASHSLPRWLSLGTGQQCIDFEQVLPDRIPINQMTMVQLTIRTLPELPFGAKYKCVFGAADPIDATVTAFGLSCPTPGVVGRPVISDTLDHVFVPLSVRSSETNKDFNPAHLMTHGANYCPQFHQPKDDILLPNNVPKEISLEVDNLPHPQAGHTGFQCIVNIEEAKMMVPARVEMNRRVVCDKTTYSYEANTGEYQATVTIVWNRDHHVDTITVVLYKCDILGSHREHPDCSLCVTRNVKYQCTWCSNMCSYNESCLHTPISECPKPRIDMVSVGQLLLLVMLMMMMMMVVVVVPQ